MDCFQFVIPPVEFRLLRNGKPLQQWQPANTEMYDHSTGLEWRNGRVTITGSSMTLIIGTVFGPAGCCPRT